MGNRWGKSWNSVRLYFIGLQNHCRWCSHKIKRRLLLGRNSMTNLSSVLKSIDIALLTKVRLVKAIVFPVVMDGCESWTTKKAEHRKIDAFELWCWRRLLRVPWTARSNQSILKEISPGCSLEGMMLKLKLQHRPLHAKRWLIGKDSDARKDWRQKEKGAVEDEIVRQHHGLNGHEFEQTLGDSEGQTGKPGVLCSPWGSKTWI